MCSCGKSIESKPSTLNIDASKPTRTIEKENNYSQRFVDTKFEYLSSNNLSLTIQNSLPKGGLKYTNPKGQEFIYLVFWTRMINNDTKKIEVKIDFHANSFELPPPPDNNLFYLPPDTMTVSKETIFNYGFTSLESFLDNNLYKKASSEFTLNPNESKTFYVLLLCNEGKNTAVRSALSLRGKELFYAVNGKEVPCGKIKFKD